jgi:hypothetical protein
MSLTRAYTAGTPTKAAAALFDQLDKALKSDGEDLVQKTKVGAAVCCQHVALHAVNKLSTLASCYVDWYAKYCMGDDLGLLLCVQTWPCVAVGGQRLLFKHVHQQQHSYRAYVAGFVCGTLC